MAQSIPDKVVEMRAAIQAAGLDPQQAWVMAEVGCADGSTTASMAQAMREGGFKSLTAHGFDIDFSYARQAYKTYAPKFAEHPNLMFHHLAADAAWPFKPDMTIMSSVLHEIESYTYPKDNHEAVPNFFQKLNKETDIGSVGVIRDFVAPADGDAEVILFHRNDDIKTIVSKGIDLQDDGKQLTFPYLIERFKQSGRAGARDSFFCKEIDPRTKGLPKKDGWKAYLTNQKSAYRFVFGKNYADMFTVEMNENYTFSTEDRYKQMLEGNGFKINHIEHNPGNWIQENRIDGNVEIFTKAESGWKQSKKLTFDYQVVIGFEKEIDIDPKIPSKSQSW